MEVKEEVKMDKCIVPFNSPFNSLFNSPFNSLFNFILSNL